MELNFDMAEQEVAAVDLPLMTWLTARLAALCPGSQQVTERELAMLDDMPTGARARLEGLFQRMGLRVGDWESAPRVNALPMLAILPDSGCRLVYGRTADGLWLLEGPAGPERRREFPSGGDYAVLLADTPQGEPPTAAALIRQVLGTRRRAILQAAHATVIGNILMLGSSLYSMQVYDRVIPTQGIATLTVLTIGVLIVSSLELLLKFARSAILEHALKEVDLELSHSIFLRLLRIRMDQFPASVGTLAAHVRSYETIRAFASSAVLYLLVDVPFAVFFLWMICLIAGQEMALIPAGAFLLALGIGLTYRKRIETHTRISTSASSRKLGLLVETVEGAEWIKASGAGWHMLNRWGTLNQAATEEELHIRQLSEHTTYLAGFLQQASYVMLVCTGAYIASTAELTMGAIIACSILSGRVLQPVGALPGLLVQWGHAKAALENLEKVFTLHKDNQDVACPLHPDTLHGEFRLENVRYAYSGQAVPLAVDRLIIHAGEKVGILGPVGAGKSTLLKLMAGLYQAREGRVMLDGLDIRHIAHQGLAEKIGYVPQQPHLFSGTLRDNLAFGLPGVTDQAILEACVTSGLIELVTSHSLGLDLPIAEGGSGVSGGQKQLIAMTRMLLSRPAVMLLDEPTSAMDEITEARILSVLRNASAPGQTRIIVTHKPSMVTLCDRLIIMTHGGIVLDGPRDQVLQRLHQARTTTAPTGAPA